MLTIQSSMIFIIKVGVSDSGACRGITINNTDSDRATDRKCPYLPTWEWDSTIDYVSPESLTAFKTNIHM